MPARMPSGLGAFMRGSFTRPLPWRFVFVNAWARNAPAQVAAARAAGAEVFLYGLPGKFGPRTWRPGLAFIVAKARAIPGVVGIVPDLENGWTGSDADEATAFGAELRELAESGLRVGVTGYPFVAWLHPIAEAAGPLVFFVVQIYGRTAMSAEIFATWWRRAVGAFPGRTMLAIAGWVASEALSTAEGFRAYLAALPRAPAAAVWPTGTIPRHIREALATYEPDQPYDAGTGSPAPRARRARGSGGGALVLLALGLGAAALAAKG